MIIVILLRMFKISNKSGSPRSDFTGAEQSLLHLKKKPDGLLFYIRQLLKLSDFQDEFRGKKAQKLIVIRGVAGNRNFVLC